MGNVVGNEKGNYNNQIEVNLDDYNNQIELRLKNEALEKQVSILKQMLKKDDILIKNLEMELKEYKMNEENNTCVICKYLEK